MLAMKQKLITLTLSAGVLEVRCLNHPQRQRALRLEGHVSCRLQLLAALKLTAGLPGEGALLLETPPPPPGCPGSPAHPTSPLHRVSSPSLWEGSLNQLF